MSRAGRGGVRHDDDTGAMTVTTAFTVAAVLAVTVLVLLLGRAVLASHTARSAADLSALAGAHALREGRDACTEAGRIAGANGADLAVCTIDGQDVVTRTDVTVRLGVLGARSASSVARAGPTDRPPSRADPPPP
ncbi:Rv3654c family TadE-like protein [Dietzia sp. NCCP-2495]|uniref:Rv3654c family TadE-like protein n=1 Tax=Dietzia sp. NCCP-2495 TaxID=2934675 RepID=UPI0028528799|nr:Rv3654c family TadE-like protein [Dietzia sp. NCCP-2495]